MTKFFSKRSHLIPSFTSSSDDTSNPSKSSPYSYLNSYSSSPGGNSVNGGFFSPQQSKKRLTRQRKLRYLTLDDFSAPEEFDGGKSKSLPSSPIADSTSPQRLPENRSSSAVPQPLPHPNDDFRFPAGGSSGGNGRSEGCGMNTKGGGVLASSKHSTYHCTRGYPQDVNGEKIHGDIRLRNSARSAPTTTFTSPTLSPKRFSTVDIFDSASAGTREFHQLPPSEVSTRRSQLHSPPLQSPTAHPLPLPPSRPVSRRQSLDQPDGRSVKRQWLKGKLLGRGTFGTVYEATNSETGSLCAIKEVDIISDDPKSSECIRQLEQVTHLIHLIFPCFGTYFLIFPYFHVSRLTSTHVEDRFCIYLEYVHPGPINKYIREHSGAITEPVVRNFTRHILSGLAYLHSKKTVHRDIKGANLLVDASGVVKLADFGLAKHLSAHTTDLSLKGSPHWMAPEVLQAVMRKDGNLEHAFTMDIWSLGCTVIEMVTGKPPWSEYTGVQALFNVLNRSPTIPETLSSEGKDFLNLCLQRNPEKRSSAALLLKHPFVRCSFDHNLSLSKQEISGLRLNEIPHNPRDLPALPKDTIQF
ncbi:hypothetical protein SSX86_025424 [Deinandra increscens subsp. villosa]|uniref:mitogen-activated protein kinase kinase kinase n=1 Tax=Deinandra increscens subsp. villosa TaxID=3103831 RepID=A0AAP0GM16_9ASTR